MKRIRVLLVIMAFALFFFIACDSDGGSPQVSWFDLSGDWDFPNGDHVYVLEADESNSEEGGLDITFTLGEISYFAVVDGIVNGQILTGTYMHNKNLEYVDDGRTIVVTLTLNKGKLTVKCEGDTPLGDNTFIGGVRQPD